MDDASIEEEYEAEVLRQREELEAEQQQTENDEEEEEDDDPHLHLFARQRTSTEGGLSDVESDSEAIQQQCLREFEKEDNVLEPQLVETLGRFFAFGGQPEAVVDRLCAGYTGNAQLGNL